MKLRRNLRPHLWQTSPLFGSKLQTCQPRPRALLIITVHSPGRQHSGASCTTCRSVVWLVTAKRKVCLVASLSAHVPAQKQETAEMQRHAVTVIDIAIYK